MGRGFQEVDSGPSQTLPTAKGYGSSRAIAAVHTHLTGVGSGTPFLESALATGPQGEHQGEVLT